MDFYLAQDLEWLATPHKPEYKSRRYLDLQKTLGDKGSAAIEALAKDIHKTSKAKPNAKKLTETIDIFLSNLITAQHIDFSILYSRTSNHYTTSKNYRGHGAVGYKTTIRVVDHLITAGLAETSKGYHFQKQLPPKTPAGKKRKITKASISRLRPTEHFRNFIQQHGLSMDDIFRRPYPLLMRSGGKKSSLTAPPSGKKAKGIIKNTETINALLEQLCADTRLVLPPGIMIFDSGPLADTSYKRLYRVFNYRSLSKGGRFYGHWVQMVPKDMRKLLTIDEEPTIEVDFSGQHIHMLYAQEGATVPAGDVYALKGFDKDDRAKLKIILQYLINGDKHSPEGARQILKNEGINCTLDFAESAIIELSKKHSAIAHRFGTGAGISLQAKDSQIAEVVMLTLLTKGIAVLPIHDSFIVKERHADALMKAMDEASVRVCSTPLPYKSVPKFSMPL